jgi:hypothetical protein
MSEVIQSQVPDANGNTIPATVLEGSMKIVGSRADNEHILVAIDGGIYNVRKATCQGETCLTCDGAVSYSVSPNPFFVTIGNTTQLTVVANWDTGFQDDLTGSSNWSSNDTTIATVQSGLVQGVGAGSTAINAYNSFEPVYVYHYCFNGSGGCPAGLGGGGSASGNVGDPTPVVTGVSPNPWNAGTTVTATITGTGFGTAGTLSFSDTSITVNSYISTGDTQIRASITIPATVTVTSHGYNGSGFLSGGGSQSSQGSNTATVVAFSAPAPRILFNGADVTGTTQNVVVGQQIALTTSANLPGGVAITGNNWSVPGTIVGEYVNAVGNAPPDTTGGFMAPVVFANTSITFYWVSPGQSMAVTYSYCVNTGSCSPAATATFNVNGPTGTGLQSAFFSATPTTPNPVNVYLDASNNIWLECGKPDSPIVCITFTPTASAPTQMSPNANAFQFVQIWNSSTVKFRTTPPASNQVCFGQICPGLDNVYPYPSPPNETTNPTFVNDSPGPEITGVTVSGQPPTAFGENSEMFNALMYLMWDPGLTSPPGGSCTYRLHRAKP